MRDENTAKAKPMISIKLASLNKNRQVKLTSSVSFVRILVRVAPRTNGM